MGNNYKLYIVFFIILLFPFLAKAQSEVQEKINTTGLSEIDIKRFETNNQKKTVPIRKVSHDLLNLQNDSINQIKRKEEENDYQLNIEPENNFKHE